MIVAAVLAFVAILAADAIGALAVSRVARRRSFYSNHVPRSRWP